MNVRADIFAQIAVLVPGQIEDGSNRLFDCLVDMMTSDVIVESHGPQAVLEVREQIT